jgi:membrane-associated protein
MTIISFIENFSYLGSFILLVLGALGLPFPEGAVLIANGFLIAGHIVKPVYAFAFIFAGIIFGDSLAYYFGRKYGEQILNIKFFRRIMTIEIISKRNFPMEK